jgi:hypothetical protein
MKNCFEEPVRYTGDFSESILWSSLNNSRDNSYRMVVLGHFQKQFAKQLPHLQVVQTPLLNE